MKVAVPLAENGEKAVTPPELYGKYLNIILFETERLTDLTRDLLTLNEFDTKELLLNKSDFDLSLIHISFVEKPCVTGAITVIISSSKYP